MSEVSNNNANSSQAGSSDPEIELNFGQTPDQSNGSVAIIRSEEVTQSQQDSWVVDDLPEEALQPPTAEETVELRRIQVLLAERHQREQELIAQQVADQAREAGMIAPREVPSSNVQHLNQGRSASEEAAVARSSSLENQARTTAMETETTQQHGSNSGSDSRQRPITVAMLAEMAKSLSAEDQAHFVNLVGWHDKAIGTH